MDMTKIVNKQIWKIICLLVTVGILCIIPAYRVNATEQGGGNDTTIIREPGSSEAAEELGELNIANTVTIQYKNGNGQLNGALRILLVLTLIAILPIIVMCVTSFTRIIIVSHFTRAALNTQTAPPNQILIGLALFLTLFIMTPTFTQIYEEAFVPYNDGQMDDKQALEAAVGPLREFMYGETQAKDVELFMGIARQEWDGDLEDIPITVLIPSFMISELRTAFFIGFLIYIPFIIIDMVVASTLMSMGMMMLPPTTISIPFKILLFVMADGWSLIIGSLVKTFHFS